MMLFYLRTLHMATFSRTLGPILVMIWEMMVDMLHFIAILMVFVAADGTILQAILYQNSPLGWSHIIGSIFKKAIFQIDGEHFFEELDGECDSATNDKLEPRCPENTAFIPIVMEAIYILFASILMLNLLIAKFSYTFKEIQENAHPIWCSQRYAAIMEYHGRPPLPLPFNVIYYIVQLVMWLFKVGNKDSEESSPFRAYSLIYLLQ
ncbi:hypothetical protein NP493_109g03003 [Ridgeia piscesae]|uniref:Ion transport domain-containing protein n=1 Tax=Ridgeia piscesae TaxID=27915 RepID=A0AAD9P7B2_RIDPI|nr:hypothetical protein NP493_109g03003 [Ridgeia piscesae]